ncbi:MAG: RNA polymerase sigma factor [bacterium]
MLKREFEKFYNKHMDKVFRYVFFRVGLNRDLAEDLVSEIFLKALKNFDSYKEEKSKSAWIITICKNHLANYWRDAKQEISLDSMNGSESGGDSFSRQDKTLFAKAKSVFLRQQNLYELSDFLESLKEDEKEIVTLHYISGYKYSEIAGMKNMNATAIKVASHRAIKKMREIMSIDTAPLKKSVNGSAK